MAKGDRKFFTKKVMMFTGVLGLALVVYLNTGKADSNSTVVVSVMAEKQLNPGQKNTIATAWQWQTPPTKMAKPAQIPLPEFDEEYIYSALRAVKLDENGDVILDHYALLALDKTLDNNKLKLDQQDLAELKDLIKLALPGKAGEQTAQVVGDYYLYLGAKEEFHSLYEHSNNVAKNKVRYAELLSVRELYLGTDAAAQLFNKSNADANYMFDSLLLEANSSLSQEQKQQQQAAITQRHMEQTINIDNWQDRYDLFLQEKRNVLRSELTQEEKRQQLDSLVQQHFNQREMARISHLQLETF